MSEALGCGHVSGLNAAIWPPFRSANPTSRMSESGQGLPCGYVGITAGVPQIADDLRHCPSRQSRAKTSHQGRAAIRTESTFRQPRFAQPIKTMLDILRVLVDGKTFVSFNCEPGGDSQHLRGLFSWPPQVVPTAHRRPPDEDEATAD